MVLVLAKVQPRFEPNRNGLLKAEGSHPQGRGQNI